MGLSSWAGLNKSAEPTFLPALRKNTAWKGVFTLDLGPTGGRMGLKMPPADKLKDFVWSSNVKHTGYWTINGHLGTLKFDGIIDSGTYQIEMGLGDLQTIVKMYPQHLDTLDIGGGRFIVTGKCDWLPKDLNFRFEDRDKAMELIFTREIFWGFGRAEDDSTKCHSVLVGDKGVPKGSHWLVGELPS